VWWWTNLQLQTTSWSPTFRIWIGEFTVLYYSITKYSSTETIENELWPESGQSPGSGLLEKLAQIVSSLSCVIRPFAIAAHSPTLCPQRRRPAQPSVRRRRHLSTSHPPRPPTCPATGRPLLTFFGPHHHRRYCRRRLPHCPHFPWVHSQHTRR